MCAASPEARLLRKASASVAGAPLSPTAGTMPPELLAEASHRLGWAGLLYACTFFAAYFGPHFYATLTQPDHRYGMVRDTLALCAVGMGLAMFVLSRRARVPAQTLLDLGLVFAAFGSLGIAIAEFGEGFLSAPRVYGTYLGIPWECVWIILYPLLAPNHPRKILLSSLASASMGPLTVLVVGTIGGVELHATTAGVVTYFAFTTYLCATVSYFMAAMIMRYGARLKRAREIGSYELVEEVGAGGMGEVWIAWHQMLARPAAVKLIRPEILGGDHRSRETAYRRFEREAQATAALGSAHTVAVYDFGITDEGLFFYVMELLDGITLDQLVKRFGPVEASRAVFLLTQVCHSLAEAHEHGLIHRDVKPANIFTCHVGPDYDFVKVLDFGLVKPNADISHLTELTADGLMTGTPAYMAPEMALAKPDADGRADIYAVGCVAYLLLTGRSVFEAETPMAALIKHVNEAPVPPSQRTDNPIPPALDALVLACLAKDPAARPAGAEELSARLTESIRDVPNPWTRARARAWWQQHQPRRREPTRR